MMNRSDIKVGDTIVVKAQGLTIEGEVVTVDFYGDEGWQIEMTTNSPYVRGGYSIWKQRHDGGKVVLVNGKAVIDTYAQ